MTNAPKRQKLPPALGNSKPGKTTESIMPHNTLDTLKNFKIGNKSCQYYSLPALGKSLGIDVQRLPVSIRIVLESVLRNCQCPPRRRDPVRRGPRRAAGLHRRAAAG
ncbi:hypothetical protein G6F24_016493 [Rhizopus arrhizus]|nr:hypothetical protein G6F24_016493 [Rhizopus arrhizus]